MPLLEEGTGGPTQAGAVAEAAIADVVRDAGAQVYEPFEAQAAPRSSGRRRRTTRRPAGRRAVYPNAAVATRAMLAASDAFEAAKDPRARDPRAAAAVLQVPDEPGQGVIIESMARNYPRDPQPPTTSPPPARAGRCLAGRAQAPEAARPARRRPPPAGATFAAALEEIRKIRGEEAVRTLPDFRLPVPARDEPREARSGPA